MGKRVIRQLSRRLLENQRFGKSSGAILVYNLTIPPQGDLMPETRKLRVFLCHSSNDKPAVRELYKRLEAEGWIDPWLDEENLYPGQDWDLEIEKAVEAADAVIVFLSSNSVTKEGYVQRELRFVLRIADFKPEGTVFVIPVRLDDCPLPRRLSMWQYVDNFPEERVDWAHERLLGGLKVRARKLGILPIKPPEKSVLQKADEWAREQVEIEERAKKEQEEHEQKTKARKEKEAKERNHRMNQTFEEEAGKEKQIWPDKPTIGGIEFIRIPKGKFTMGEEKEKYEVDIPYDYFLARFEVTNEQFKIFVEDSDFKEPWGVTNWQKKHNHPVINVSWFIAQEYSNWLNQKYGADLPDGLIYRLPTEAEWEKAARGTDERKWPWGNVFDSSKCNSSANMIETTLSLLGSHTIPVSECSPRGDSPYGVSDMAGNVWEWTHSLYWDYPYNTNDGRESENSKDKRVVRGGSFVNTASDLCTSFRGWQDPTSTRKLLGFRVAIAPPIG